MTYIHDELRSIFEEQRKPWLDVPQPKSVVMNRQLSHISKTLALLAVTLLPVEQTLAATCCCRNSHGDVKHIAAGWPKSCCSPGQAAYCRIANASQRSCCEHGQSHSDSKPCRCPAGCLGKDAPDAVVLATDSAASGDELSVAVMPTTALGLADGTRSDSLRSTTSRYSTSASQRCVLLCRYRL